MSESIYDQLQGPRDPWEYAEMGQINTRQARLREKAGQVTLSHESEAPEDQPTSRSRPTHKHPTPVPVSQLSAKEKRIRDARPDLQPAPTGTANPVVLNEPGAIGLPDQTIEASTQAVVEAGFAKLHALTQPSHEISSESAESFFEALHGHSPRHPQS
jgi:hypothetical protein